MRRIEQINASSPLIQKAPITQNRFFTSLLAALCFAALALVLLPAAGNAQDSPKNLNEPYHDGQIFTVPNTDTRFKLDVAGFVLTHDRQITDRDLLTLGHAQRRVILKITYDTLFEDIEPLAEEYHDLWWYFYTLDTTLDVGGRRQWTEGETFWSTHMNETSYNIPINEKHYDMFVVHQKRYYHISIKRPMYLEGDSIYMLQVMNSFEFLPPLSADSSIAPPQSSADSTTVGDSLE